MPKWIPEGWHSVTPRLVVHDPPRLVQFLRQAFGATGDLRTEMPSVMKIGGSLVMVSGVGARDATPGFLYLYVDDADATYHRALEAGAVSIEEPGDMPYGDRRGMVEDPFGNIWQIATHKMLPVSSGYADVNGIRLYHEIYGAGERLVLLHGGLMTIPEMAPLVQALSDERQVIAVELQGHGRTVDTKPREVMPPRPGLRNEVRTKRSQFRSRGKSAIASRLGGVCGIGGLSRRNDFRSHCGDAGYRRAVSRTVL